MRKAAFAAVSVLLAIVEACDQSRAPAASESVPIESPAALASSLTAEAHVNGLRAEYRSPPAPETRTFELVGAGGFRAARPPETKVQKPATVILPMRANQPVVLEDDESHVGVTFVLRGANDAPAANGGGIVLHASAFHGADLVRYVHTEGIEDYVAFGARPDVESIDYDIDVSRIAGLRMVANTVELVDRGGAPRLRVAPPYVLGRSGEKHPAKLAIIDCGYDSNPAAPWGRPAVSPGAASCTIRVSWSGVSYPAMVDPGWSTTGSMTTARSGHTMTMLATGKVLVVGGSASADLYDPASGTFAATGSMALDRTPTATLLGSGKVLVAGGRNDTTAELYDPVSGTFATTASMVASRTQHTASLLGSGKVLLVGGSNDSIAYLSSAELYDPGSGSFTATTGSLTTARNQHAATVLNNGDVLVSGGYQDYSGFGFASASMELYHPATGTFDPTGPMTTLRFGHVATLLSTGKVLLAADGTTNTGFVPTAELYDPALGTSSPTGMMGAARPGQASAVLPTGDVLVAGGGGLGNGTLASAEVYNVAAGTFAPVLPMTSVRVYAVAITLPSGKVLVSGGGDASAEIYNPNANAPGIACSSPQDCAAGFCVDGACCNTACNGQCEACDVAGHVGTCTPVLGTPHGSRSACAATSKCNATCDGQTAGACTFPPIVCDSSCSNATETDDVCDETGSCVAQAPHACNNLVCEDDKTCKASCSSGADCRVGFTCSSDGKCASGGTCTDEHTSVDANGEATNCAAYKCGTDGACMTVCVSVNDCIAPAVCDSKGRCGAPPTNDSAGCTTAGSETTSDAAWFALTLVGLLAWRRSR